MNERKPEPVKLTDEQAQTYLTRDSGWCPYCDSTDIEGQGFDYDGNTVWQRVRCNTCGREWGDIHHLTQLEELDENRDQIALHDRRDPIRAAADRLSKAVHDYFMARHLATGPLDPRVIEADVILRNCQQAYEQAAKP